MAQPDILATYRTGLGYLSTTFNDPTDLTIIYRKWIFGDGVIVEGSGFQTVSHTYYYPGEYNVTLVAQTSSDQYSVTKDSYITVDIYSPTPAFIISQSFDIISGCYWRLYFDQNLHIVFEDNDTIFRSIDKVVDPGKWVYVDFDRSTGKFKVGNFSYYVKEIQVVQYANPSPMVFSESHTDVLPNSTMKLDELRIWSVSKDTKSYYEDNRGKAGYLDTL